MLPIQLIPVDMELAKKAAELKASKKMPYTKLHSKIERGDQEEATETYIQVRRSRADAGNEAI